MLSQLLNKPLYAAVILFFIGFLGAISFWQLPISFLPDISRPTLTIQTTWPGYSADQVLEKIIVPQESELNGIPDRHEISSMAYPGFAETVITFRYNTELDDAYMNALQAIGRVAFRPADALPTTIEKSGEMHRMAFLFVQASDPEKSLKKPHIDDYQAIIEKHILPEIQAVHGVSHTKLMLASEDELQITVDINALNKYGLIIADVVELLSLNKAMSLGAMNFGKHSYQLRFNGKYSIDTLLNKPILSPLSASVTLADIASVTRGRSDRRHFVLQNGKPAIGIDIYKSKDANMLAALEQLYDKVATLNQKTLPKYGLHIEKSFDPTVFIHRAINLISSNLLLGTLLSALGLALFTRNKTLIVTIFFTVPVTLLCVFTTLYLMGKSLNVISLAAIALSTGIILDASIVVLSAIRMELNKSQALLPAIEQGVKNVVGALLSSTLTSVVIFAPILIMNSFEGQLFEDLALTLSLSILFSLFVSIFLLPVVVKMLPQVLQPEAKFGWISKLEKQLIKFSLRVAGKPWFLLSVGLITMLSFKFLLPDMDLLPPVKRDVVDNLLIMPKGQNLNQLEHDLGEVIHARLAPHLNQQKAPFIKDYYLAVSVDFSSLGVRPLDKADTEALKAALANDILKDLPGIAVVTYQAGVFGAMKSSRTVTINLFSEDVALLQQATTTAKQKIAEALPGVGAHAAPSATADMPILTITPNFAALNQYQIPVSQVIEVLQMTGSGLHIGKISEAGKMLNVKVKVKSSDDFDQLLALPVSTSGLTLRDIVTIEAGVTVSEIMHVNFKRALSLTLNVPDDRSIEAVSLVAQQVVDQINNEIMQTAGHARLSGSTDVLAAATTRLLSNLAFAGIIFFFILLLLFQRIDYSLIILVCLPVAAIGSLFALQLAGLFYPQQLDVLTMMGFLILIGLIVNNAILFVDAFITAKGDSQARITHAFEQRLLPILMSTVTSIIGMLPLALLPGAGNELYRGLGVVLVGGMSVGGLILLIVMPGLLLFHSQRSPHSRSTV